MQKKKNKSVKRQQSPYNQGPVYARNRQFETCRLARSAPQPAQNSGGAKCPTFLDVFQADGPGPVFDHALSTGDFVDGQAPPNPTNLQGLGTATRR